MSDIFFRKTYLEFSEFVADTKDELIILSPYIKLEPLKFLLKNVNPNVKVIVVARWKLGDLIFGSSDIKVFEYLRKLGHAFYINNKIHLKIIVKDKKDILVGSANITGSGLGLFSISNIEAIAIDSLDEKYLPSVYSILRESILVDQELVNKISKKLYAYMDVKFEQEKINKDLEKIEKSLLTKKIPNIMVYDFPFSATPDSILQKINSVDNNVRHDLKLFGLKPNEINYKNLEQAFINSNSYGWQLDNVKGEVLFGKYSELLHNALVDNPKPYRKRVKELVANMFNWTKEISKDFEIIEHQHTSSMIKKNYIKTKI